MTQTSNALLPPLVRREALRSYFERVKLLNSPYSGAITMGQARMKWSTPDWSLPTGLSSFANTYGAAIDQPSARYWVARHTLAPYYQTTLDWYRCERFLHRLLEPAQGPRRPLLPISLTEWFSKQPVLCPVCDEEALDQRGFSHVQRHWLLPFLTRCHIHGEPLAEYSKWAPPTRGLPSSISILPHRTKAGALLTEVSLAMLEREPWQLQELGELVQSRGFTTRAGRLRRNHLCDLLITHAKGRYEHPELDLLLASKSRVARLLTPLWSKCRCLHPVVAHVLVSALRDQPAAEQMPLWSSERQRKVKDLDVALETAATATQAAKQAGVSVTTAVVHARAVGKVVLERPKRLKAPLRQRIVKLLATGEDVARIATKTEVSLVSVYRVLASNPTIREGRDFSRRASGIEARQNTWLDVIDANPRTSAKALRILAPAIYAYLYRWSREWLLQVTPKTGRAQRYYVPASRAPAGAEFALAKRLSEVAKFDPMDMPARKTRTSLMAGAGRPNDVPATSSAAALILRSESESLQSFVVRRLTAAVVHLQNQGVEPVPWKVERESGLRPSVIAKSRVRTEVVVADTKAAALKRL